MLSEVQIDQAFNAARSGAATSVGAEEWEKFTNNGANGLKEKVMALKEDAESVADVSDTLGAIAPKPILIVWSSVKPVLLPTEELVAKEEKTIIAVKHHVVTMIKEFIENSLFL